MAFVIERAAAVRDMFVDTVGVGAGSSAGTGAADAAAAG
jgi:hypothetical protein